jgi:hypothetical protein
VVRFLGEGILTREERIPDQITSFISLSEVSNTPPVHPLAAGVEAAKGKCSELGFRTGTEKFGECFLRITR